MSRLRQATLCRLRANAQADQGWLRAVFSTELNYMQGKAN